jgi:NAD(P)-dependent dehydrogenase (short-subunit alcohol dehydrogenase family)
MQNTQQRRVWLITGCSSGFGRELALAAAEAGDWVMATARRPETLTALENGSNGHISTVALDVTDPASIDAAVQATLAVYGRVDVVVNNAGSLVVGAVEELSMADLRRQMEVVFFGAAEVTKAVVPLLRRQGSGTIVQMSSLAGQRSFPGFGAYHAAKFALEGMSESLAAELAPLGVRVIIVEPGAFRTGFNGNKYESEEMPAYRESAGVIRRHTIALTDSEPGDPAKGAAAILKVLDSDRPPLRLVLGGDALDAIREHHDTLLAELATWEDTTRSTAIA